MHHIHQKRASHHLELYLQVVVNYHIGVGNKFIVAVVYSQNLHQAIQISTMDGEGTCVVLSLAEEVLVIDDC